MPTACAWNGFRPIAAAAVIVTVALWNAAAWGQLDGKPARLGANLDELRAAARQLNPELAASALEAEAAAARADAAGRLADPTFTILSDQNRNRSGVVPSRLGNLTYTVQQAFPLGGKRDLARGIAGAEARQAGFRRQALESELDARVKAAFAEHYRAVGAAAVVKDLRAALGAVLRVTEGRYAQGRGSQQDVLRAQSERTALDRELIALAAEQRRAKIRLNTLLNRAPDAALAEPRAARVVPPASRLDGNRLAERLRTGSPVIAAQTTEVEAADGKRRLVDRSWVPDLTLGFGVVDAERRMVSYEAMIGLNLPLRWGLREAQAREAGAAAAAARSRQEAAVLQAAADLADQIAALAALDDADRLLRESVVPQSLLAFRTAQSGYELNQVDLRTVIESYQRWREAQLDRLRVEADRQARMAEIERLIGGDL